LGTQHGINFLQFALSSLQALISSFRNITSGGSARLLLTLFAATGSQLPAQWETLNEKLWTAWPTLSPSNRDQLMLLDHNVVCDSLQKSSFFEVAGLLISDEVVGCTLTSNDSRINRQVEIVLVIALHILVIQPMFEL
jgi:hypothetical protein